MSQLSATSLYMLPRTIQRATPLAGRGQGRVTILYPGREDGYVELADLLALAAERACGQRPEVLPDIHLMPDRHSRLPDPYRQRQLILLGNLTNNRAVRTLYAQYFCATDAAYPGGEGYDLRTIVNPYGTGANVILAGGSRLPGVRRAVEHLIGKIGDVQQQSPDNFALPFMLDVVLTPALARALDDWPDTSLASIPTVEESIRKTHGLAEGIMKAIGAYGIMYAWTGDQRYGLFARDCLRALNKQVTGSYGDWHYRAERVLRVLPWLCAGGFLDDEEIHQIDQLLLGTALGTCDMWWRMRHGRPPLGHRHHGRGTFEFLLLAHYLKEQANPSPAVRALCDRWIGECQAYLDALGRAGIDDQDDESTLTNLATVFWYALGEERLDFFEEGSAHLVVERVIALHDSMGSGAGQGGYGEGLPGAMYLQQEATVPIAASAFYYQDERLKAILEQMPHLKEPLISGLLHFSPYFIHMFQTGPELSPAPSENLAGMRALPITSHQVEIASHPPEHIEDAGHSVEAEETWLPPEGVGLNRLPRVRLFDKIVLRGGTASTDPYLLLQGYQGGFRWQGHMQAANCIVRFSQAGHIFLIQNTSRHSHYFKNGLFIGDGYNNTPLPPIAERLAVADFPSVALSATRLADFHHADWTRHLFWSKRGAGAFVVIDTVQAGLDGPFGVTCTWRTPGYAELDSRGWEARQGQHCFRLRWSEPLAVTSAEETDQGAAVPYVLRQVKARDLHAGDRLSFQNLFYVYPAHAPEDITLHKADTHSAYIMRDGSLIAWCGVADAEGMIDGMDLSCHAISLWATSEEIAASGLTQLHGENAFPWHFEADYPVNLHLDLAGAKATVLMDDPAVDAASLKATFADRSTLIDVSRTPTTFDLPPRGCRELSDLLNRRLRVLTPGNSDPANPDPFRETASSRLRSGWVFDRWTTVPKRLRDLTVTADPAPLDGFPEQLIDTVVAEIRQTRQQWPSTSEYKIVVTLPEETVIDTVRIVGDSNVEPTLRTFHRLPDHISVDASSDSFQSDVRECSVSPQSSLLRYKLYRDTEDQFEAKEAVIGQSARQIRVHVPAPADGVPLVLHEIEVYSREQVRPRITHLMTADLDGNGSQVIFVATAAHELVALSENGEECWRQTLPGSVTHLSCHDLDGSGRNAICIGVLGGELRILSGDGSLRQSIPLAQTFLERRDAHFGRVNTINTVQVWHREPDGRAALVAGGYSIVAFLDPDGNVIGHSWADGSWQTDILVAQQSRDLYVRNGWNHGVGVYEGRPGMTPSGETIPFGGLVQPLFRGLRKVIPFVNGKTAAFEWLGDDQILAAAENGVGVLSTRTRAWLWKIEGGVPIRACIGSDGEVIVGGADGFLAGFGTADGQPRRRLYVGAPVVGLVALDGGVLAVGTRCGILILDRDWKIKQQTPVGIQQLVGFAKNGLLILRADGKLELLTPRVEPGHGDSQ